MPHGVRELRVRGTSLNQHEGAMQRFRKVRKLGVIYNSLKANSKLAVEQLRRLAPQFPFELIEHPDQDRGIAVTG